MSMNFGIKTVQLLSNHISYLWGLEIQKSTINNKVRAIEQIFVLDPVK